ncbi:radical SAM protein [Paenibacillus sp. CAA11]|uniref:SPL family radical SAM protein n=1 Tax=Paenibacillus sp. CAA11 TaxID=1532905 RepID=UPI000D3D69EA|nr:radical SAM protein [Paenibacillus sp. CAA11]AWB44665.1 radical SAM protein [Paenibacillus sp. CAA11]
MTIEVKDVVSRKILNEASGYLDIGFTHSLNPYSGCAFACKYCYVREMPIQQFKDMPWGEWVEIKTNAVDIYKSEMIKLRRKSSKAHIFMSSATDPYQPIEREAGITRAILEAMLQEPPDLLQIQTRSPLVTRDIDLLTQLKDQCQVLVSMTIETDREEIKRIFAPYAPGINMRLEALKKIHDAGIYTQAALSPVLPFTPQFPTVLAEIADRIWIDTLNIGDGRSGKRSERLGMPQLFKSHGLSEWYRKDIHIRVKKYFMRSYPPEKIHVSKEEAFWDGGDLK